MEQMENEYVFREGRKGNRSHVLFYGRLRPAQEISHGRLRLASYADVLRLVTRDEPKNVCVGG